MKLEDFAKNKIEDFEKMEIEDMDPEDLKTLVLNKMKEAEYREFHAEVIKNSEEYLEGRVELVHNPFSGRLIGTYIRGSRIKRKRSTGHSIGTIRIFRKS